MVVAVKAPTQIIKRDGSTVDFDPEKIHRALERCFISIESGRDWGFINELVWRVVNVLSVRYADEIPTVEQVQDVVIYTLQSSGEYDAAEHYIIYRHEHAKKREENYIPLDVVLAFEKSKKFFPTPLQEFQFYDKYSRFNYNLARRETWPETVRRARLFLHELTQQSGKLLSQDENEKLENWMDEIELGILKMEVTPSMRLLAMAGEAARRDNASIYNCSYLPIDGIDAYCELMALTMAGCGVGYSVESVHVDKFTRVNTQSEAHYFATHIIDDSTEGWIDALRHGLEAWISGGDIEFDYSLIRPQSSPLKTKGGRASGPEPLRNCLDFIRDRILAKAGKKLTTLDCHDIACAIGRAVVSGGVRRTALIALFDEDDQLMLQCKTGDFEKDNNQRWCANNSAVWTNVNDMTQMEFVRRMWTMFESERGEPGIFSRETAVQTMPVRRRRNATPWAYGTNPCGEIVLRPWQFCNLSAVVAREDDTLESLKKKVRLATIIGTLQSCATYFPNLRSTWKFNCEQERLLGVDITGQMDCKLFNESNNEGGIAGIFTELKQVAIDTNKEVAELLGINESAAITCVKPSGNSAVLLDCSSGIHPRWAPYYIRNVRITANSPMYYVLRDVGMPMKAENGQDPNAPNVWVVSFPVKSPDGAYTRSDVSAVEQCERWLENKKFWTEHNPSVSVYYRPEEALDLINWMWYNRSWLAGMTVFPHSDAKYDQLPFVEISEDEYNELVKTIPTNIPFERLWIYDNNKDHTTASQTLACEGPVCLIE